MKITPIEIKQHSFKTKMRGYCPEEVHAFLEVVSGEFGKQKDEIKALHLAIKALENELKDATNSSSGLENLANSISSMKEDLLKNAEKEASLKIEEGKIKATRMIQAAERKITTLESDIQILESRKQTVKENVSSFLQNQLNSLVSLNTSFEEGEKISQQKSEREDAPSEKETSEGTVIDAELVLPQEWAEDEVFAEVEIEPLEAKQ